MTTLDTYIFSIALSLFLLIGSIELVVEKLISLVRKIKELKTTIKGDTLPLSLQPPSSNQTRSKRELGSGGP